MRTFNKICAQGDVLFVKIDKMPKGVVPVPPRGAQAVVTHSETGHDHVMLAERTKVYEVPESKGMEIILEVLAGGDVLEHLRGHDTHESIRFEPGLYHVRRQREYVPEGFRRVED
jgi:hypothetical protein